MPRQCSFCAIVAGATPAAFVFRDEVATAFLDTRPLFVGHTLVVPNEHHETLAALPSALVASLFERVRRLSAIIPATLDAEGSFVAMNNVVSQSVPHLHVHVVPRTKGDGLRGFFWPRTDYEDDGHIERTAATIAAAYESD